tara:strand:- start:3144 stop:3533 length:390 start_codon:yes stop_codon:yes gene_type:complete
MNWFRYADYFVSLDKEPVSTDLDCDQVIIWIYDETSGQLSQQAQRKSFLNWNKQEVDIPDKFSGFLDKCNNQCTILPPWQETFSQQSSTSFVTQVANALTQAFGQAIQLVLNDSRSPQYTDTEGGVVEG